MAREARKKSESGNYFVTLRGNGLFITDEDRSNFGKILEKNFATGIIHACGLSDNEIRLAVKEGDKGISAIMKSVTIAYARYFNRVHDRTGKLFSGRFLSEPLESDKEIEECIKDINSKETVTDKTARVKTARRAAVKNEEKGKTDQKAKKSRDTKQRDTKPKKVKQESTKSGDTKIKSGADNETPREAKKNLPSWLL